jgi:hypothetical protein
MCLNCFATNAGMHSLEVGLGFPIFIFAHLSIYAFFRGLRPKNYTGNQLSLWVRAGGQLADM